MKFERTVALGISRRRKTFSKCSNKHYEQTRRWRGGKNLKENFGSQTRKFKFWAGDRKIAGRYPWVNFPLPFRDWNRNLRDPEDHPEDSSGSFPGTRMLNQPVDGAPDTPKRHRIIQNQCAFCPLKPFTIAGSPEICGLSTMNSQPVTTWTGCGESFWTFHSKRNLIWKTH